MTADLRAVVGEMRETVAFIRGSRIVIGGVELTGSKIEDWANRLEAIATPDEFHGMKVVRDPSVPEGYFRLATPGAGEPEGWRLAESGDLPERQRMVLLHCAGGSHLGSVFYGFYGNTGELPTAAPDFYVMYTGGRYYPAREAGSPVTHWRHMPKPPGSLATPQPTLTEVERKFHQEIVRAGVSKRVQGHVMGAFRTALRRITKESK